jgi:hypothetical protein
VVGFYDAVEGWVSEFGGELEVDMYSKEDDLASCGMLPREAILVIAGGWPEGGGGVVLPS